MPWWGDDLLASDFALEVLNQLGPGWDANYGPVFAHGVSVSEVFGIAQPLTDINDQIDVIPSRSDTLSYASPSRSVRRELLSSIELEGVLIQAVALYTQKPFAEVILEWFRIGRNRVPVF